MERKVRNKWIHLRVNECEFEKIEGFWKASTCNKLSDYARTNLLKNPVIIKYRNGSADAFLSEMIGLKNELSAIGKNFNQMVKKLHAFDHSSDVKMWAIINETSKLILDKKMQDIREKLNQIYEQWLQK